MALPVGANVPMLDDHDKRIIDEVRNVPTRKGAARQVDDDRSGTATRPAGIQAWRDGVGVAFPRRTKLAAR